MTDKPVRFRCPECKHPAAFGVHARCIRREAKKMMEAVKDAHAMDLSKVPPLA